MIKKRSEKAHEGQTHQVLAPPDPWISPAIDAKKFMIKKRSEKAHEGQTLQTLVSPKSQDPHAIDAPRIRTKKRTKETQEGQTHQALAPPVPRNSPAIDALSFMIKKRSEKAHEDQTFQTLASTKCWSQDRKLRNRSIKSKNGNRNSMNVLHWNAGKSQWIRQLDELNCLILAHQPDLLFVSEAGLYSHNLDFETHVPGYSIISSKTLAAHGYSRMNLLVKEGIIVKVLKNLMHDDIASIWLGVQIPGGRKFKLCGIYREHKILNGQQPNPTEVPAAVDNRWRLFLRQCVAATAGGAEVIITGDVNLDFLKWDTPEIRHSTMVEETKQELETLGFSQQVRGPTRFWPNHTSSLLDQTWTNQPGRLHTVENLPWAASDHNIVRTVVRTKNPPLLQHPTKKRSMKNFNPVHYKQQLANIDWTQLYSIQDVNLANHHFQEKVLQVLDSMAPLKCIQNRRNYRSWVKDATKSLMEARNLARHTASLTKTNQDWNIYKELRNLCSRQVKSDKKEHLDNLYTKYNQEVNTRNTFKLTKELLGWNSPKTPATLKNADGSIITAPLLIANKQVSYFSDKVSNIIRNLPNTNHDPLTTLRNAMNAWNFKNDRTIMKLKKVNSSEVLERIKTMGSSTAYGHDTLDSMAIKTGAQELYIPITYIVNISISTSTFANTWKIARIIPLHKGKHLDKQLTSSYRPISLLPIVSKIVEHCVQKQVLDFMEKSRQFNRNSHAYRRLHSTTTAYLQLTDLVAEYSDKNLITVAMAVDETAAFDCVEFETLKEKLRMYNFHESTITWFDNYLKFRSQYVSIGTKSSNMVQIRRGVPQGSVLSPVLFSIYTNDLPNTIIDVDCQEPVHGGDEYLFGDNCPQCGTIPNYADDATCVVANPTREQNQVQLTRSLEKITSYLNSNHLAINQPKTALLEIMTHQKRSKIGGVPPSLVVKNPDGTDKVINPGRHMRLLGGNLQQNLSWQAHLEVGDKPLLPDLRKKLGALRHLGPGVPRQTRLKLANATIISRILYLLPVWGGAPNTYLNKIQVILNKSARYVNGLSRRSPTQGLMESCQWLDIRRLEKLHSLALMWKILWMKTPLHIHRKITVNEDHTLSTQAARLQTTQASFRWRTISTWNSLPHNIRQIQSLRKFKTAVRRWLKESRHLDPD